MTPPGRRPARAVARDGEISASECAKRIAITAQSLGMWAKRPGAPVRIDGRRVWCQWPAFARWREAELCRQAVDEATKRYRDAEADGKPKDPFVRKTTADARKAEIEVELLEKSVVPVPEAMRLFDATLTNARAVLMPFARVVAPKVIACANIIEAEQLLDKEVKRVMAMLAVPELVPGLVDATEQAA